MRINGWTQMVLDFFASDDGAASFADLVTRVQIAAPYDLPRAERIARDFGLQQWGIDESHRPSFMDSVLDTIQWRCERRRQHPGLMTG